MLIRIKSIIITSLLFFSCKSKKMNHSSNQIGKNDSVLWHHKDFNLDNIPGISLEKWYKSNNKKSKNNEVIVAVVDTQVDIDHEDLRDNIWVNTKEIPNNNIDDDKNGYVDDINGWNFIGYKKSNYSIKWMNHENVRILRQYKTLFSLNDENQLKDKDKFMFNQYKSSKKDLKYDIKDQKEWIFVYEQLLKRYESTFRYIDSIFPKKSYSIKKLDSIIKLKGIGEKYLWKIFEENLNDEEAKLKTFKYCLESNFLDKDKVLKLKNETDSILDRNFNVNYQDRKELGDNENNFEERNYGNSNVGGKQNDYKLHFNHGTEVASVVSSKRYNSLGLNGISNDIKIMPITTSSSGDEHDKDIANAIYYAVDNGAKVINMSFWKDYSLNQEVVTKAILYAEKNNVLIVHISGNKSQDIDKFYNYPNDYSYELGENVADNFINVGSTNKTLGDNFVSRFSNYGKNNVDIFAPGANISVAFKNNQYGKDSGTSLAAPMVSGTVALIWLYYPKLTASQVKQIIMQSGTSHDIEVIVPGTKDKKVKFSELSKSGKVLNVYNAMLLAEKVSKGKVRL